VTEFHATRLSLRELDDSDELFQSGFWGAFKEQFGWRPHPLQLELADNVEKLLVLSRRLVPGFELAYVPYGPAGGEPDIGREDLLAGVARAAARVLPRATICIRFDLPWHRGGADGLPPPLACGPRLRRSAAEVQPQSTVLIDLRPEEGALLAAMKSKTRYNIGLAERKGVRVTEDDGGRLADWYRLYQETARRDRITVHSLAYYRGLFDLARVYGAGAPTLRLLLADVEGDVVAGIIVATRGGQAFYLYGASSDRQRNAMPNHALQWHAIRAARSAGCRTYDMFGIPASADPGDPMAGLLQFKTGFGGAVINRYGCYDAVLRPAVYAAFGGAERLRRLYYKRLRKRR
jgi:lipid II:glycine glycyltransferase (peptidoglycan interpeptide bridge formation enzyme)